MTTHLHRNIFRLKSFLEPFINERKGEERCGYILYQIVLKQLVKVRGSEDGFPTRKSLVEALHCQMVEARSGVKSS